MRELILTGGIAVGKSTILRLFANRGAKVINSDQIVHHLYNSSRKLRKAIIAQFGEGVSSPDGIDRVRLAELVFTDNSKRKELEQLVHPYVIREVERQLTHYRANNEQVCICEIPLFFAWPKRNRLTEVILATCSRQLQLTRVQLRNHCSVEMAAKRIDAIVAPDPALADYVIYTDGDIDNTEAQVEQIWQQLTAQGNSGEIKI